MADDVWLDGYAEGKQDTVASLGPIIDEQKTAIAMRDAAIKELIEALDYFVNEADAARILIAKYKAL